MVLTESDIKSIVYEVVKSVIKENAENELVSWHGTIHNFDEFDTSFIGTGESTQVYGWGLYMTGVKETGKYYAALIATNKNKRSKKNPDIRMNQLVAKSIKEPFKSFKKGEIDFPELKSIVIDNMKKNGVDQYFIDLYSKVNSVEDSRKFGAKALEIASRAYEKFLYTVEIPDEGFIDWNGTDRQFIMNILKKFSEHFDVSHVNPKTIEKFGDLYCQLVGGKKCKGLYKVSKIFIAPKDVSLFLKKLGFNGISVPIGNSHGGDGTGMNYVIFDGKSIKVINKELI